MKKAPSGGKDMVIEYTAKIHIITDLDKFRAGLVQIFRDAAIRNVMIAPPLGIGLGR